MFDMLTLLPTELVVHIFSYLTMNDLVTLSVVDVEFFFLIRECLGYDSTRTDFFHAVQEKACKENRFLLAINLREYHPLVTRNPVSVSMRRSLPKNFCKFAIEHGRIDILEWAKRNDCFNMNGLVSHSIRMKQISMFEWLQKNHDVSMTQNLLHAAAESGDYKTFWDIYVYKNRPKKEKNRLKVTSKVFYKAAIRSDEELLHFLETNFHHVEHEKKRMMVIAAEFGNLHVFEYYKKYHIPAFCIAMKEGHVNILRYFEKHSNFQKFLVEINNEYILEFRDSFSKMKNITTIEWVFTHIIDEGFLPKFDQSKTIERIFVQSNKILLSYCVKIRGARVPDFHNVICFHNSSGSITMLLYYFSIAKNFEEDLLENFTNIYFSKKIGRSPLLREIICNQLKMPTLLSLLKIVDGHIRVSIFQETNIWTENLVSFKSYLEERCSHDRV